MQRFYFDWYDDEGWHLDEYGVEMDGSAAALEAEASKAVPELAREQLPNGTETTFKVCVRDENGPVLETVLIYQRTWHRKPA